LVVVFGFFVHGLLVLLATTGIAESSLEVVTINCHMIGTWMPWAFLLQELLELLLRRRLLASRGTIHSRDEIIWLTLSGWTRIVPLAFVVAVVMRTPQIAILAPWELFPHLLLLFRPVDRAGVPDLSVSGNKFDLMEVDPHDPTRRANLKRQCNRWTNSLWLPTLLVQDQPDHEDQFLFAIEERTRTRGEQSIYHSKVEFCNTRGQHWFARVQE
jgi:hypothetical protein